MGEPAGIGPELILKAWMARGADVPSFLAIADGGHLRSLATSLGLSVQIVEISSAAEAETVFSRALPVLPLDGSVTASPGVPGAADAPLVIAAIERAVALAQAGEVAGLVTQPIAKHVLKAAGFGFPGHTEFLGHLAGGARPVMMLAIEGLRVVPVTVHVPLAEVPRRLDEEGIVAIGRIVAASLARDFGIARPRLAVAGLNPHAGEAGTIGREETDILAPAISRLAADGIDVRGPLSADTMFHAEARAAYDAALCMYHDQALIPLKTLDFHNGVNVTIGLPFVRTSPDHGTAFDIAGRGVARADSTLAAIRLAARMAASRAAAPQGGG